MIILFIFVQNALLYNIIQYLHTITISNTTGVISLSGYLTTLSFLAVPSPSTQCQTTSRSCTFGAAYITSSVCVSSSRFSYPTIQPSHHTLGSRKNCKYPSPYKSGLNFPKGESSCQWRHFSLNHYTIAAEAFQALHIHD